MAKHTTRSGGLLPAGTGSWARRAVRRTWSDAARALVAEEIAAERATRAAVRQDRLAEFQARTPKAGEKRPWASRTTRSLKLSQHRSTTATLAVAYPFLAEGGLGADGIFIGRDSFSGASFCYDGLELYNRTPPLVSNTNMLLAGNIGWGKTNLAMAYATRSMAFGRRIHVPGDPKDDWVRLALAVGGQGIRLGKGLTTRLNPLDGGVKPAGMDDKTWQDVVKSRRQNLLIALVCTASPKIAPLDPLAVSAVEVALAAAARRQPNPELGHVAYHLAHVDPQDATDAGYSADLLAGTGQQVYAVLTSLVTGSLAGLFDGQSTVRFDPNAPMLAVGSAALGDDDLLQSLVMLCSSAWVSASARDVRGGHVIKIYDEAWRIIGTEAQLDRMNADLRLSRAFGESNMIIMHALSDPDKVGNVGSAAVQKARGLLSLCDTRVVLRQAPGELDRAVSDLGMTQAERDVVAGVGKGEALWKLPTRSFRVQTVLTPREKALFNTDARMTVDGEGR